MSPSYSIHGLLFIQVVHEIFQICYPKSIFLYKKVELYEKSGLFNHYSNNGPLKNQHFDSYIFHFYPKFKV